MTRPGTPPPRPIEGRMTVLAAMHCSHSRSTWLASDTASSSGDLRLLVGPKWIVRGPWALGVAGHLRTMNLFEHHADSLFADLQGAYDFSQKARDLLRADGYVSAKEDTGPLEFGQALMLAHATGVWTVGSDFSFSPIPADTFWAEGSGRDLAIGAAHALNAASIAVPAREVVRLAVEAALAYDFLCGGPAWIAELTADGLRLPAGGAKPPLPGQE